MGFDTDICTVSSAHILLRDTGATLSPFHAFIFLQDSETLSLRVERHVQNALKIVDYLAKNPKVELDKAFEVI